jgi:hypothetical protein
MLDLSGEEARKRIGDVERAYLTSAGGTVVRDEGGLERRPPDGAGPQATMG